MPDQLMRERLLAILNPTGWAQVERLRAAGIPDEEVLEVVGHNIETVDRLLTVLADLPDTAVEAGADAVWQHSDAGPSRLGARCRCREVFETHQERERHAAEAILTAAIAATKEGKA